MPLNLETQVANTPQAASVAPQANNANSGIGTIGSTIINAATGGIGGLVAGGLGALGNLIFGNTQQDRDAEQLRQQAALQQQQIAGAEQLTDYNRQSQLEYTQAQYAAQMAGMKEAGVNPALMYGGGGGGGTTGGQVVQPNAPQAADSAQTAQANAAQMMQIESMKVMESQANLNNAQATKISGADTENENTSTNNIATATSKIAQETNNLQIEADGKTLQNIFQGLQNKLLTATLPEQEQLLTQQVNMYTETFTKLRTEVIGLNADNAVKQATINTLIATAKAQLQNLNAQVVETYAKANNLNVDSKAIAQQVQQGWEQLKVQSRGQDMNQENVTKMVNGIMISAGIQAGGQLINTLVKGLMEQPDLGTESTTTGNKGSSTTITKPIMK